MMCLNSTLLLLLLGVLWTSLEVNGYKMLDLYEGDICHQEQNTLWTCKHHRQCAKAAESFKKGVRPDICGFQGKDPIVCCEPEEKLSVTRGAKANTMCKKYAESVYLPLSGTQVKIDTCKAADVLILDGVAVESQEFPHMAQVGFGDKDSISWYCGGSLVSERFVLSSAQCTDSISSGPAKWVRLGDWYIRSSDNLEDKAQSELYEITERTSHPGYDQSSLYNDIAVFKLDRDVKFTQSIRPACLQTNHQFTNTYAIATSWAEGRESDVLQKVNMTITHRKRCSDEYKPLMGRRLEEGIQDQTQMCARERNDKDVCQGDTGGPFQVKLKDPHCMYALVGVTSFGSSCGRGRPVVYTRVSNFVPWIESLVWPDV